MHSFVFEALKNHNSLVHGTSPRYFESEEGKKVELSFARKNQGSDCHQGQFLKALGIPFEKVFLVRQVHGDRVQVLDDPEMTIESTADLEADAIVTRLVHRPIGVLTADCVPIVIYDQQRHVAGVVHAGRRGTAKGIFFNVIRVLNRVFGSRPENLVCGLGPAIGKCCYEVDEPCLEPFRERFSNWEKFVSKGKPGKYFLDLHAINSADGRRAGVHEKNIFLSPHCTSCEHDKLFSYRREGATGRTMTVAMLYPK